jgi:hypothetical protein
MIAILIIKICKNTSPQCVSGGEVSWHTIHTAYLDELFLDIMELRPMSVYILRIM